LPRLYWAGKMPFLLWAAQDMQRLRILRNSEFEKRSPLDRT
jgi:hypothetical protein